MIKPDEIELLRALVTEHGGPHCPNAVVMRGRFATDTAEAIGMHVKRLYAILLKWTGRGDWDYGTNARGGWFTPQGWEWAQKTLEAHK